MTVFKGDNSTISLLVEDNGWGKPMAAAYTGAKVMQNNDGTFNASRNALESEARTPNAELGGVRLGNKNVAGSFPVEVDPENYNALFESLMYGSFDDTGSTETTLTGVSLASTAAYQLKVPMTTSQQGAANLNVKLGDMYLLSAISVSGLQHLQGVAIAIAKTSSLVTFMVPTQKAATLAGTNSDITIKKIPTLRPAKKVTSFNAEETLYAEDGATQARFMTAGAVVSGASFDLPSEGTVKTTFSLIGSGKTASSEYKKFDPNLTNSAAAHTSTVPHVKYDPVVLQDGAIISNTGDVRCVWLSGTVGIENGTEAFFTGCSYDAQGSTSGKLRINLSYEAMFQSEADYVAFENENDMKIMIQLKVRGSDKCLVLYLPAFKATGYTLNNATGLVTASITGSAVVSESELNSFIMGSYKG